MECMLHPSCDILHSAVIIKHSFFCVMGIGHVLTWLLLSRSCCHLHLLHPVPAAESGARRQPNS
jgi:hypothetical protein